MRSDEKENRHWPRPPAERVRESHALHCRKRHVSCVRVPGAGARRQSACLSDRDDSSRGPCHREPDAGYWPIPGCQWSSQPILRFSDRAHRWRWTQSRRRGLTGSVTLQSEFGVNLQDAGLPPNIDLQMYFQKSIERDIGPNRHHWRDAHQVGKFPERCGADRRKSGSCHGAKSPAKPLMRHCTGPESQPSTKRFMQRAKSSPCLRRFRIAPRSQSCFGAALATTPQGFRRLPAGCCRSQPTQ